MLNWIDVCPGDTYFIPAGTVHAIGAGIALCEVQQNSDITYRLYDYGRDRPLHLKHAAQLADLGMHPGKLVPRDMGNGVQLLAECRYFRAYRATLNWHNHPGNGQFDAPPGIRFLIVLEGAALVNGFPVSRGQVLKAPGSGKWVLEPERQEPRGTLQFLMTG